jgi:hypothetical protein
MQDESLKRIFHLTLVVVNFLNGNTSRGDNYGFKLSEVEKVCDVRSFDHKKTVLQYIITKAESEAKQELVNPEGKASNSLSPLRAVH